MADERDEYVQRNQMLSLQQAAKMFNVSLATLRKWLVQGSIPHFRVERTCRIARQDLENFRNANYFSKPEEK